MDDVELDYDYTFHEICIIILALLIDVLVHCFVVHGL